MLLAVVGLVVASLTLSVAIGVPGPRPAAAQDNEAADADAGDAAAEVGDDEARTDRQRERDRQPEDTERDRRQDDTDEDAPADEADELDGEDFDCIDFQIQEDAQEILDEDPDDPYNLDPNADGIACSSLPASTDTVQVTAVPKTGTGPNTDVDPAWAIVPLAAAAAAAHGFRAQGFLHD